MLCQSCRRQEATIHYFESINGNSKSLNLCERCATSRGIESFGVPLLSMDDPVGGGAALQSSIPVLQPGKVCVGCGKTYADFRHDRSKACPACFDTFSNPQELRRRAPAGKLKGGLVPQGNESEADGGRVGGLRRLMEKAVELEQFEEAARLRDLIRKEESSSEALRQS
jgi:protein arginine kinase activator